MRHRLLAYLRKLPFLLVGTTGPLVRSAANRTLMTLRSLRQNGEDATLPDDRAGRPYHQTTFPAASSWQCFGSLLLSFLSVSALFAFCFVANAQEERPEPGTIQVQPLAEDAEYEREETERMLEETPEGIGFLRVWAADGESGARVAVGLVPTDRSGRPQRDADGEFSEFVWLFRGMRGGDFRDYIEVPSGAYRFVVVEETDPPPGDTGDEWFRPPRSSRLLMETSENLLIPENSRQTAVVRNVGDRLDLEIMDDTPSSSQSKRLRVFNFAPVDPVVSVRAPDGRERPIWGEGDKPREISIPPTATDMLFVVSYPNERDIPIRRHCEANFASSPSNSIVIFQDRYGRTTAKILPDKFQ